MIPPPAGVAQSDRRNAARAVGAPAGGGMTAPVTLLMAVHCHQPVGNFDFVFEEAFVKSYDPFLRVVERHPRVHLSLHYSGCLLDWLTVHQPKFLARVRALVTRGQVELLASGYYEPILPVIPEADRQGQIAHMRAVLHRRFGADPTGLWLTERVWEPDLPESLSRAGIRYTIVDTNQFASAKPWLPGSLQVQDDAFWDLLGCYSTEHAGSSVVVFPASKRLRYWMPFQAVERTVDFLKRLQRDEPVAITFADDGEKFGLWPKTYRWVYEEGWLDQFFGALERECTWLQTATFREHLQQAAPNGLVYLPCGSYEEMLEWSGGYFRNFFTKYPEANAMQQKMLRISRTLSELKAQGSRLKGTSTTPSAFSLQPSAKKRARLLQEAKRELYAGQCNCAYWHGVFGGLYLAHLRRAVYAHLIAAEALMANASGERASIVTSDVDGDGQDEALLSTPTMRVIVDPAESGAVTEWSLYGARLNLLDTFSRRAEPYHDKLRAKQGAAAASGSGAPASIHDALGVKDAHLESCLIYDDHRRSFFLDYALQRFPTLQEVVRSTWGEQRLWSPGSYRWERGAGRSVLARSLAVSMVREAGGGQLRKTLRVAADRPRLECGYELRGVSAAVVGLEFNLSLRDERYLSAAGEQSNVATFRLEEPGLGVALTLCLDPPATLFHFPIETVSESEEGLERTYQGLALVCLWAMEGRSTWRSLLRWDVERP